MATRSTASQSGVMQAVKGPGRESDSEEEGGWRGLMGLHKGASAHH